ncbi:MAG: sulfatase, partial [Anaerolineae bacterium]|nr:sulfatase [Anaerolineae bacterium]
MPRPNILMITCHDIGQHLGCYGVESVQTPNLDKLAQRGIRFHNFYATSAVCSPARGSLHTGRYPQSNGLLGLTHAPWWWQTNPSEKHTAAILKNLGYRTYLIGFNHIDPDTEWLGYDKFLSQHRKAKETVAEIQALINSQQEDSPPWFAKVGFTEVHRPFTHGADQTRGVTIPPWLQDTPDIREDLSAFQATIQFFDDRVGEILDCLHTSEVSANTLVIMTSDHGIPYPGAKWTVRKAGVEIPFIVYQPDTVFTGGKVFQQVMSHVDVLPTLLDYLEAPIPSDMQGLSFWDVIRGTATQSPREMAFSQYTPEMKRDNTSRSVITDRYHLIRYFEAGRTVDYPVDVHPQTFANHEQRCKTKGTRPFVQLYDISQDPYELHDIGSSPENQDIVKQLSQAVYTWMVEVQDPLLDGPVSTPYYQQAMQDFMNATNSSHPLDPPVSPATAFSRLSEAVDFISTCL